MSTEVSAPTASGVQGNARLTALMGLLLTILLLIEGATVLDVRGMITLHLFVGLMLIPPVLLKTGSTLYRFGSYYRGRPAYVRRGAPHVVLRVIGPLVVLSSVALLGTGVWLLLGGRNDTAVTLHQGSFIVWIALMTVHFLGHLKEACVVSWHEMRRRAGDPATRHRSVRLLAVSGSLVVGVGLAAALTPPSNSVWEHHHYSRGGHPVRRG